MTGRQPLSEMTLQKRKKCLNSVKFELRGNYSSLGYDDILIDSRG